MAKQDLKFTIEDVAGLILSLGTNDYCALEPNEEQHKFEICDYCIVSGKFSIGNRFRLTIYKDKVDIFYYPTLNISLQFKDESEFHEILSLYLDFKDEVKKYLISDLKSMIRVNSNHKNPFFGHEVFMDQVRVNQNARRRRIIPDNFNEIIDEINIRAGELNDGVAVNNVDAVDFEAAGIND